MKCPNCGVDLYEGIKKCPYCKTVIGDISSDGKFKDFDFKYTISPADKLKVISEAEKYAEGSKKASKKKSVLSLPFKFKRIKRRKKAAVDKVVESQAVSPAEKAKGIAKSASRSAAEFIPEGVARYTIRGADNRAIVQAEKPATEDTPSVNEYKRVIKPEKKSVMPRGISRRRRSRRIRFNINKRMVAATGAAVVALVAVILAVSAIAASFTKDNKKEAVSSFTYVKNNAMYVVYKGRPAKISDKVICDNYLNYAGANQASDDAKSAGLVKSSKDGKLTYFFDDFDPETEKGTLKLVKKGNAKKIIEISSAVHNSIVLTDDGKGILYLWTTNESGENGNGGVLFYWNEKLKEPLKIATDIDKNTFSFAAEDEWVVFIQNLNRIEMQGDLFAKNLKDSDSDKVKIDSAVCKVYGENPENTAYIYGKDYDKNDKSFDIYAINEKGHTLRLGERTKRDPIMQKTKNAIIVYGFNEDKTNEIYTVNIATGKKEKLASKSSSVLMLSKDEKTVIYDKVYNGKLADYFVYYKGKQPLKIAHDVVVDYNAVAEKPQMAVSEDVSKILYISEFNSVKGGGTLNLTTYKKGEILSEEKIADDVHSVYRGADGKFIVAKDYSTARKIFDVYVLDGKELRLLREEVSPELFAVSSSGDYVLCVTGFDVEGKFGTLEKINLKAEQTVIENRVFDFEFTNEDDILIYSNLNTEDGRFDIRLRKSGSKKNSEIDNAIDRVIGY